MTSNAQTEARTIARYSVGDIYWLAEYGRPLSTLDSSEIGEFVLYTDHVTALAATRSGSVTNTSGSPSNALDKERE